MKYGARFLATQVISQFEKRNAQLSLIRNEIFSHFSSDQKSKSRANILIMEVIRFKSRLDLMIEFISGRSINHLDVSLLSILRISFYEIIIETKIPNYAAVDSSVRITRIILSSKASGFTNAVLRNLVRKKEKDNKWYYPLKEKNGWHSIPHWLEKRWVKQFGKKGFLDLVKAINKPAENFVRVDCDRLSINDIIINLSNVGIQSKLFLRNLLKVRASAGDILKTSLFRKGEISIQNPAASIVVDAIGIRPDDIVLDVCAGLGTKTLQLSNLVGPKGYVWASDLIKDRIKRGKSDLKRHKKNNIDWSIKDARKDFYPKADRILIDAPCTGTGVIARKPDIRWRRKPRDIYKLSSLQFEILSHCSQFLKSGGTMVYSTCSMEKEENWSVIEQFINLNHDFVLEQMPSIIPKNWIDNNGALRTLPHIHNIDGMFAVRLKRLL